jgi:hypothetical protein
MKLNMKLLFVIIATIFLSLNYIIALNSKSETNIKNNLKEDTLEDEFDENDSVAATKSNRREGTQVIKERKGDGEEEEEENEDDDDKKPKAKKNSGSPKMSTSGAGNHPAPAGSAKKYAPGTAPVIAPIVEKRGPKPIDNTGNGPNGKKMKNDLVKEVLGAHLKKNLGGKGGNGGKGGKGGAYSPYGGPGENNGRTWRDGSTSPNALKNKITADLLNKWAALFRSADRGPACKNDKNKNKAKLKKKKKDKDIFLQTPLPIAKPSPDDIGYGAKGDIAYWFDYTDSCWRDEITGIFTKMFDEAKAIEVEDNDVNDIYSITNQLKNYASSGLESQIPMAILGENTPQSDKMKLKVLQQINKKFNVQVFENSISLPQIRKLIVDWNWIGTKMGDWVDPGKHIVDKYDWNGDGRLNAREFIFWTISDNLLEIVKDKTKERKSFVETFIDQQLDPFFTYADCDGDGLVSSEEIWQAGMHLKCKDGSKFKIYDCDAKADDNDTDYRTACTNDFILKNEEKWDGYNTRDEFYRGTLLGFWDRQVGDGQGVVTDDILANIGERWGGRGLVDTECQNILRIRNENKR